MSLFVSPRMSERPMTFTAWEFARGALIAWLVATLLYPIVNLLAAPDWASIANLPSVPLYLLVVGIYAAPVTLLLTLVVAPVALLLGFGLRGRNRREIHVAAFAVFGALYGAACWFVLDLWFFRTSSGLEGAARMDWPLVGLFALMTSISVVTGWCLTVRMSGAGTVDDDGQRYRESHPMAFTWWEFTRGALMAWVVFVLVLPTVLCAISIVSGGSDELGLLPVGMMFSAPYAFAAMIAWSPAAFALAWLLRRTADRRIHGIAFAALGAVAGAVTWFVIRTGLVMPDGRVVVRGLFDGAIGDWYLYSLMSVCAAIAVSFSWLWTAKRFAARSE